VYIEINHTILLLYGIFLEGKRKTAFGKLGASYLDMKNTPGWHKIDKREKETVSINMYYMMSKHPLRAT
jgi:hypothetical protein